MADDFCKEFTKVQKKHKVEELTILVRRVHQAANVGATGLVARSNMRPILHPHNTSNITSSCTSNSTSLYIATFHPAFGRYWTIDGLDRATRQVAPTEDLMPHGSIVH